MVSNCKECGHWDSSHLSEFKGRCNFPECNCKKFIEQEDQHHEFK